MDALTMRPTPEQLRRQRTKNVAVALALVALVVLFFVMSLVRMGGP